MRISLLTLGCRVNQSETISIEKDLIEYGHEIVNLGEEPDICIVNTCTVTSKSDYQSRQLIRRAHKAGATILVTGCYAELNKEQVGSMDGVKDVIANSNKDNIINIIGSNSKSNLLTNNGLRGSRTRKFLKVQDGCNYSCSFCLVTKARGPSRSISPHEVIDSVNEAVNEGFREVVINGVHLGLYGKDMRPQWAIDRLVEYILLKTKVSRIRLGSLEINEITERLLDLITDERICRHLHIPLQSGDDGVLKEMKRNYDTLLFRNRIESILNTADGMTIGTDIIAGFPTETEESFNNTMRFTDEAGFAYIHIFPYSKRNGTLAAEMTDIVGSEARKQRASSLRDLAKRKQLEFMTMHVGKSLEVLIEEKDTSGLWRGTSSNYLKVLVSGDALDRGSLVHVRILGMQNWHLAGSALQSE